MQKITVKEIIDLWPSKRELAADVSRLLGKEVQPVAVHRWVTRERIPAKYDRALILAAAERGQALSLHDLMCARTDHIDQGGHSDLPNQGPENLTSEGVA